MYWGRSGGLSTSPLEQNCLVRSKTIKLTPEEAVRQLYLRALQSDLG